MASVYSGLGSNWTGLSFTERIVPGHQIWDRVQATTNCTEQQPSRSNRGHIEALLPESKFTGAFVRPRSPGTRMHFLCLVLNIPF